MNPAGRDTSYPNHNISQVYIAILHLSPNLPVQKPLENSTILLSFLTMLLTAL
jgi:hypothetical protein